MDLAEKNRDMERQGMSKGERASALGTHVAVSGVEAVARLTGVASVAEMTLRAGGMTSESAQKAIADMFEHYKTGGRSTQAANKAMRDAVAKAGADVRKQYKDAYTFLDAWTPDDFDVADDFSRKDLRSDLLRMNQGRLEAWADDANNTATRKAARDTRGD